MQLELRLPSREGLGAGADAATNSAYPLRAPDSRKATRVVNRSATALAVGAVTEAARDAAIESWWCPQTGIPPPAAF